jgi:putative transposase
MYWRHRRARRPAANEPGHVHELTFSCFHGFSFLRAERTCQWLADAINAAREKHNFSLWAYVFMPTHVHLLIYLNELDYNVSAILKAIKQPAGTQATKHLKQHAPHWLVRITVKHRNRIERRFWQAGGGFDRNTIEPHVILAMIDYIHGNPVRKELVEKPEDWKWSSAGWVEGRNSLRPDPVDFGGLVVASVG